MSNKFESVPMEDGTKILFQTTAKFDDHDVLYQKWYWDGITAESLIFVTDDIADIEEESLLTEIRESPLVQDGSEVTISRSDSGFTFFNFNFVVVN